MTMDSMQQKMNAEVHYRESGGTKLRLVKPHDKVMDFNYMEAPGAIRAALAPFGKFQTGVTIKAPLYFPPVGQYGCSDMRLPDHKKDDYNMHWRGFVIVLDGECTYEEKARRVEKMGAQALVIAHDPNAFVGGREFHASDSAYDGSGQHIAIPTIIIDSIASEKLLKLVRGEHNFDEKVILKAEIEISNSTEQTVSYSLYYGSLIDLDDKLLAEMYNYQHALGANALFIPRILTFECPGCPVEIQRENCVSDGTFCFTPPSEEKLVKYPQVTTMQLIQENLRQRCVYEVLVDKEEESDMHHVFNYLFNVHMNCLEGEGQVTDMCAESVLKELALPIEDVNECIEMSYEYPDDLQSENDLLRMDRDSANDLGVQLNPSLSINGKIFHGKLKANKIFESICHAYKIGHQPDVCDSDFELATQLGNFEEDFVLPSGYGHHHLILVILLVLLFNIFLFIWCKNRRQKGDNSAMQSQVQMQVEKYFRLQGTEM